MFMFKVFCRDRSRTPMQWDNNTNAGFTNSSAPWLPVNPDFVSVNVEVCLFHLLFDFMKKMVDVIKRLYVESNRHWNGVLNKNEWHEHLALIYLIYNQSSQYEPEIMWSIIANLLALYRLCI